MVGSCIDGSCKWCMGCCCVGLVVVCYVWYWILLCGVCWICVVLGMFVIVGDVVLVGVVVFVWYWVCIGIGWYWIWCVW